jgi:4-amino-4-deoxy-L-arabinose transferase-like glycosyltransferase
VAHGRPPRLELPMAGVLAVGLGLCWMVLIALVVHWLPGPIGLWSLVGAYTLGALLLTIPLVKRQPVRLQPGSSRTWVWLAVLILAACLLRLPGLGYQQFQEDETEVLQRARFAIEGVDTILGRHTKGPGEIAVAIATYRGLGTANEATARLPFALMGVTAVVAIALLGQRLFSPWAGFWAGALLVFNGFALAPSRLVQYQAAMLLLSVLAVSCAWEFAQGGEKQWLVSAAVFSTFGVAVHYEFLFLAPVLMVLAWVGWKRAASWVCQR